MELKSFFAQDTAGNVVPSPTVYVYAPGTTTLSTGLKTKDNANLSNPFTGTTAGLVQFAAPDGNYDVRVVGGGRDVTIRTRFIDAVAYAADLAAAKARANHTGTQAVGTIIAANGARLFGRHAATAGAGQEIQIGANLALDPATGVLSATGGGTSYTSENARDDIAAALVAGANITITPNDVANTITIAATGGGGGGSAGTALNVKDYGATGDGTTNDTTAINNAITAARSAGKSLFVPKGTYSINSTINLQGVAVQGEGAKLSIFKLTHAGVGLQIGYPLPSSGTDTLNRAYGNFGILANTTTTLALFVMRCIFCEFAGIEIIHPYNVAAGYKSFRISGACYYNKFVNCFSETITEDWSTTAMGWHIGNGENEVNHEFAACNANTFINCRSVRANIGMDIDNCQGGIFIGGGVENATTNGIRLRGSGNHISGMWLESADLKVDDFTPATGSGGFGAAQKPARNQFSNAGINSNVNVNSSTGIHITGTLGNLTIGAGAYNTQMRGQVNGTFTNNGQDGLFEFLAGGSYNRLVQSGSAYVHQEVDNASEYLLKFPNSKQLRVHAADNVQVKTMSYGLELQGNGTGDGGFIELPECNDPGSAPTNRARLFVKDNGSGKTQLCIRYATGVTKVLDTEA